MWTNLDGVSKLIVKSGEILLDGMSHTTDIDCRLMTGEHELIINGEFDFRNMNQDDYQFVSHSIKQEKQTEIDGLTVELLETEYQLITGEAL